MRNWSAILETLFPSAPRWIVAGMADAMPACISYAALATDSRLARFVGQCGEESDHFRTMHEYASGAAYEGRADLGNVQPGDGVRFKGRGAIELTGRANYRDCGRAIGIDLEADPSALERFPAAALAAAWFWSRNGCNAFADRGDDRGLTRRINGGLNGYAERVRLTRLALRLLAAYPDGAPPIVVRVNAQAAARSAATARNAGHATLGVSVGASASAATPALHAAVGGSPWPFVIVALVGVGVAGFIYWRSRRAAADAAALSTLAAKVAAKPAPMPAPPDVAAPKKPA